MHTYKIHFHRYHNGDARVSRAEFVQATNFAEAHKTAEAILMGLRGADAQAIFSIVSIESRNFLGKQCNGARMFETREEFELRCQSDADDEDRYLAAGGPFPIAD